MLKFLQGLSGEKVREALWIICIIILFGKCTFFDYCPESPMLYTIISMMFADLLGQTAKDIFKIKSTKTT